MINAMRIEIENDMILQEKGTITLHFTYDRNLTLKEMSEILALSNMAINDFNRANGVRTPLSLSKLYAPEVVAVKEGSAIFDILLNTVHSISTGVLANYLYGRLSTLGLSSKQKKEQRDIIEADNQALAKYPINIYVNGGNVHIHVHNNRD